MHHAACKVQMTAASSGVGVKDGHTQQPRWSHLPPRWSHFTLVAAALDRLQETCSHHADLHAEVACRSEFQPVPRPQGARQQGVKLQVAYQRRFGGLRGLTEGESGAEVVGWRWGRVCSAGEGDQ
jgi:hypothetical protein